MVAVNQQRGELTHHAFDQIGYNGDDLDQGQTYLLPNIRVLGIHQLNQLGKHITSQLLHAGVTAKSDRQRTRVSTLTIQRQTVHVGASNVVLDRVYG